MEPIIAPVDKELIKAELTPDRFMRDTRKGGNKIYIIDCNNAPNVMREIGRLREIAFRYPGGGTGLPLDIDEFDTMDPPCQQLIVWNPDAEEIIGGYRFIVGENIRNDEMGRPRIATSHLFEFSQKFLQDYLPHTIFRESNHVPHLLSRGTKHDTLFFEQTFSRPRSSRLA